MKNSQFKPFWRKEDLKEDLKLEKTSQKSKVQKSKVQKSKVQKSKVHKVSCIMTLKSSKTRPLD